MSSNPHPKRSRNGKMSPMQLRENPRASRIVVAVVVLLRQVLQGIHNKLCKLMISIKSWRQTTEITKTIPVAARIIRMQAVIGNQT